MCVFYVFVMHLHHLLQARLRHQVTRIHDIEDLATSCMVVYLAFETRMHELMRGWRSQGRDIELQLGRYADGLFKNIHREVCLLREHATIVFIDHLIGSQAQESPREFVQGALRRSPGSTSLSEHDRVCVAFTTLCKYLVPNIAHGVLTTSLVENRRPR